MNIPEELRYTKDHEWVRLEGDVATIGITDHAQAELSDVVFVELPDLREANQGDPLVVVESVKAASDVFAPVGGEVIEVNEALVSSPAEVNTDPYGSGWLLKLRITNPDEFSALMDAGAYGEMAS